MSGLYQYLVQTADDDAFSVGESYYRNIKIFEDTNGDLNCDQLICNAGDPCDDGDPCTTGETYDANCNCFGGTAAPDSDNDGFCDVIDQCPGFDDNLIGTACDDGDPCTIGETYNTECACAGGVFTDEDGDGICIGNDPDDNDPCNPDPNNSACNNCVTFVFDDFENGYNIWNDGGSDCFWYSGFASSGTRSIRLRDNSGAASSMFTDPFDFSGFSSIQVDFSYYPESMENNEDFFLEVSTNGGNSFTLIEEWNRGTEFENNIRYFESVEISNINFTTNTVLRFRCDASGNGDRIYIDDVLIQTCGGSNLSGDHNGALSSRNTNKEALVLDDIQVYPNPVLNTLNVDLKGLQLEQEELVVHILGMDGQLRYKQVEKVSDQLTIDVGTLPTGNTYLLKITTTEGDTFTKKFIKI